MPKKWIVTTTAAAVVASGAVLATQTKALAHRTADTGLGGRDIVVERLATAFGKSEEEVRAVFEELHQERHQQHQAQLEEKLEEAVSAGQLTETQRDVLLEKFEQHRQQREEEREAFKDLSPEERQAAHEERKQAFQAWAEEQGIDLEVLQQLHGQRSQHRGPALAN